MRRDLLQRLFGRLFERPIPGTAARRPAMPNGLRVYAIGDIHGFSSLLDRMAEGIDHDLRRHPVGRATAVFVGDYVDRGPDSAGVIERLVEHRFPIPFETLRGNHEDLMLRALDDSRAMEHWCHNGGLETMRSYGVEPGKASGRKRLDKLRTAFAERFPDRHRAFLESTRLSLPLGDYFFVHAGARPGVPLDAQAEDDLMWIREECYDSDYDFGKVLVHGHTPHRTPEDLPRRINVDTGAFKWGVLTAVALEGETRRFLSRTIA